MNPLLEIQFRIPFDKIQPEHVGPAIDELLERAHKRLEETTRSEHPLHKLDTLTENLDFAMGVVRHLEGVATTPELREAYNAVQPKFSVFHSSLPLNEGLWTAIQRYSTSEDAKHLDATYRRFLTKTIDTFKRHGAELDAAGKVKLQEIDVALAEATTKFSQNVLDSTNAFELIVPEEERLQGLPPAAIAMAKASAESKGQQGWRFTLQGPSYVAAMTYLDDRAIREQLYRAYSSRATASGPGGAQFDNRHLIVKILDLRKQKAVLLGFRDFADFVLEDRMAHTGSRAKAFLDDLEQKTEKRFKEENQELEAFANQKLEPWDVGYWAEKQRAALYDFDEEALRPYFPLDRVMEGMYRIFGDLFGIRVKEEPNVPGWAPEVRCYRIEDSATGANLGSFYADWYPRENKRGGAWMDAFLTGNPQTGEPHLGLICGNLTPPVGEKPALLTHREVETIFHEFGHLLHHLLSRVEVKSLAGTNVAWDFVELPSQIMENWCWEREALNQFARHWETGEPVPEDLFQKMKRAKTFRAANMQMRQLSFGIVDLALHREWDGKTDVIEYSRNILQKFSPTTFPPEHAMIAGFTHLFASPVGYGAGYYSYKWAEVLEADAFTRFKKEGVFSEAVGRDYRNRILAKGDSEDPAVLYRSFMGRDPDPNALLQRAGLTP
jgi:oligopeptidase A